MKKLVLIVLFVVFVSASSAFADSFQRPSVAVVLSGGGAKGIAHIGILEKIEELGIPIDRIYGTSIGALIGGFYAAGYTPAELAGLVMKDDLQTLFYSILTTGYNEVLEPFDFYSNNIISLTLGKGIGATTGLIDDYKIMNFFDRYLGNIPDNIDFDKDLCVSFRCNAVNVLNGINTFFDSGSLIGAIRSSISIPIVFEPVYDTVNNAVYMDGGLSDNMPVSRAVEDGYDIIISVSLSTWEELDPDTYDSFSGTLGGLLEIIVRQGTLGEGEMSTLAVGIDTSGYSTLGFNKSREILELGREAAREYEAQLKEIADLFTEDQKVLKDSNRTGEYFTKYGQNNSGAVYLSGKESRKEDLLGKTRVSLGFYGGNGYSFSLKGISGDDAFNGLSQFKFFPTFSVRLFLRDKEHDSLSYDLRLKATMNRDVNLNAIFLKRLAGDRADRFYFTAAFEGRAGSLTEATDKSGAVSFNYAEYDASAAAGIKETDGQTHSFNLRVRARNIWTLEKFKENSMYEYWFLPGIQFDGIIYPGYSNGIFSTGGTRIDFIVNAGLTKASGYDWEFSYILKAAAEHSFRISDRDSVWVDAIAATNRGPEEMRDFFEEYGGWDGMPGYNYGMLARDLIMAGVGYQRKIKNGYVGSYISAVLRVGVRSDGFFGYGVTEQDNYMPFYECFKGGHWDMGLSVGYGLESPAGDIIIGFGLNKDLIGSVYLELK